MPVDQDVDLRATARTILRLVWSLIAWATAAFLFYKVSLRAHSGASSGLYVLPIMHLFPWVAAMKWLWSTRRAVRDGSVNQPCSERCYRIIEDLFFSAYAALMTVEIALILN